VGRRTTGAGLVLTAPALGRRGATSPAILALLLWGCAPPQPAAPEPAPDTRVSIDSDGWQLIGDLRLPPGQATVPAVLMLNQAAGSRTAYAGLAGDLERRGVASLRLDLRGHGESVNLGRFVPGEVPQSRLIWDAEVDVMAAHEYLVSHPRVNPRAIAIVGGSYSGEEMAEAGRLHGYAQAYVALSPGSFSDESIAGIDASGVPWLFVTARDERFLQEITAAVRTRSRTVELLVVPGAGHATNLLSEHHDLGERIAVWLAARLTASNEDVRQHRP